MAVVKCKECGGLVSTKAKACPSCGAKQAKQVGVLGWIFCLVVVLPIAWSIGGKSNDIDASLSAPSGKREEPAKSAQPAPNWTRYESTDSMTDERYTIATVTSSNGADFDFPYRVKGGSKLHLTFRKKKGELDAMLRIDKGNMLCNSLECRFSLRVGDGPVQKWTGLPSSTHDHDVMFVRDARELESIIKSGETIRVGIQFFQAGERVFKFDTSGYPGV